MNKFKIQKNNFLFESKVGQVLRVRSRILVDNKIVPAQTTNQLQLKFCNNRLVYYILCDNS